MTKYLDTQGIELRIGDGQDPESFTLIPGIKSASPPKASYEEKEVSNYQSQAREFVFKPLADNGEITFEGDFIKNSSHNQFLSDVLTKPLLRNFEYHFYDPQDIVRNIFEGSAGKDIAIDNKGVVTATGWKFSDANLIAPFAIVMGNARYIVTALTSDTKALVSTPPVTAVAATTNFSIQKVKDIFAFSGFLTNFEIAAPSNDFAEFTGTIRVSGNVTRRFE